MPVVCYLQNRKELTHSYLPVDQPLGCPLHKMYPSRQKKRKRFLDYIYTFFYLFVNNLKYFLFNIFKLYEYGNLLYLQHFFSTFYGAFEDFFLIDFYILYFIVRNLHTVGPVFPCFFPRWYYIYMWDLLNCFWFFVLCQEDTIRFTRLQYNVCRLCLYLTDIIEESKSMTAKFTKLT